MVDCLSIVTRSIRVRTAKLLGGAMASISAFDVEDVGSSPTPITNKQTDRHLYDFFELMLLLIKG